MLEKHSPISFIHTQCGPKDGLPTASQGVRQPGYPNFSLTQKGEFNPLLLLAGELFISTRYPNKPQYLTIPIGCVGLVHTDDKTISIVRDDCQAVRRFKKQHNIN